MASATTAITEVPEQEQPAPPSGHRRTVALAAPYYLLAALAVTLWLWRDPASRTVAGNPYDADQLAWFFRYDATAIAHGHLPALITTAMNAPRGVNVMWNTFMLLPGALLTPVTLLLGPQTALNVFLTAGFAGSSLAMFAVLRRWDVSTPAAALGGAVYGFSPAVLHSAIGHYDLQFAVLPPLIIHVALRLATGRAGPVRGGLRLGLLVTAQLFITEEILAVTAIAGLVLVAVLAASRPRAVPAAARRVAIGLATAAGVTALIAGYPLWVQFFGPLRQHGSPFMLDYFKNDLSSFVVPSSYQLFHTAGSAAAAARYQGLLPEYLGYLGWPLLVVLVGAAIACWRRLPARAAAVACVVLGVFSLGGTLLFGGHHHPAIKLPWYWLQGLPLLESALPDRFCLVADGTAAALLAFAVDAAVPAFAAFAARRAPGPGLPRLSAGWRPAAVVMAAAVLATLPILPKPLPVAAAAPVPAGWSAAFAALRLPPSASVLVVPVPMSTFTEPLRWQADTGEPRSMVGGYFMGPGPHGRGYIDGDGTPPAGVYLNALWVLSQAGLGGASAAGASAAGPSAAGPSAAGASAAGAPAAGAAGASATGNLPVKAVTNTKMREQIKAWKVSAVVAVATPGSPLGRYLTAILGSPAVVAGDVMAWRFPAR